MEITRDTVVRAWKDEQFRHSLPVEVREALPEKPVGSDGDVLTDEHLEQAAGGITPGFAAVAWGAAGIAGLAGSVAGGYAVSDAVDGDC